ncbi:nucleotide sugar dehydrogenase [Candidatus Saganbacteria bacterium]|nr:nucleotide sugar dehydrogenase [Candidatus Saganbacteria bacterium]
MPHDISRKIAKKQAVVSIIGLGYVGLPLAVAFADAGFKVIGLDLNGERVDEVNKGKSYIIDVSDDNIKKHISGKNRRLLASKDFSLLSQADVLCICVPTPLDINKKPDMSCVVSATRQIAQYLKEGQLVVLESTTYPGTTEGLVLPCLQSGKMRAGRDFYLAFSPERIDPGNNKFNFNNVPKIVGGITKNCTRLACAFYSMVYSKVLPVSSPQVAEMEKLLENIFRNVNIALVNEMALLCRKMGINIWEVIEAANSKPYGFMPFYPGPGVGGHCIPVDPFYLSWKAKEYDTYTRFIELAGEINDEMPKQVVNITQESMNIEGKCINGSKFLVLGVAYKKDINDVRESPALKIINLLKEQGGVVFYHDPCVPFVNLNGDTLKSCKLSDGFLTKIDCALLLTDHSRFDYDSLCRNLSLVIDTRNAIKKQTNSKCKIIKL